MTKKKERKNTSNSRIDELAKAVKIAMQNMKPPYSVNQVIKLLGIKDRRSKQVVKDLVKDLQKRSGIATDGKTKVHGGKVIEGRVDYVNAKFAYIVSDQSEEDVMVKHENMMGAFDDDLVEIEIFSKKTRQGRLEGKVLRIIERVRDEFVGRIQLSGKYAFVIPDFRKMHTDIFIPPDAINKANSNDKVIVKITQWPTSNKSPEAKVIKVLGQAGEHEAEMHSIIAEFGLPYDFSSQVLKQAEKIEAGIGDEEISKRKDFRSVTTVTIDPEDAKDFDDALSLRILENGHYEVGIHIADVTHYVSDKGPLEKEAQRRGTSVYLVDRTIPMLPERLSNELCSLRPNEDRLTFSAVFELDGNAKIKKEWFGKTIIHSDRRFTYEEAQERIEKLEGDFAKELTLLNELALKLQADRYAKGSISFETTEVKFRLDDKGKPLEVIPKIRKDAHKLVEEFMLLANKRVAEFVHNMKKGKAKNTFVYRTHDYPDPEKLQSFSIFAKKFGYEVHLSEEAVSRSLNRLISEIEGKPEENVLQSLAIRSMAKAKYTTDAGIHFGLAFQFYTHFTSPIRRYPDMMVHRLLHHYLNSGKSLSAADFEKKCKHSSEMEKRAADAERASIKYKQVEYMAERMGEDFAGLVSGVTEWGIFVEMIETKCEGMVRISDIDDDYYEYDEANYRIVAKSANKYISLGDEVVVKVVRTDINRRTIDLELISVARYEKDKK
ncbi:MAG: ribonuclease R [Cyclobacteriaceae bacterium]|nr:ribonuclease R [Cyclobacteriaceae bacterium]